jgi:hypothetical protein
MNRVFKSALIATILLAMLAVPALAEQPEDGAKLSLTTGLPTDQPYKPVQMTLDNEPGARPQIGMSHADIVYEFEAYTGGPTRYLAIFNDDVPKVAEGCRSTRIPALEMYWNFGGALVHYGGWIKGAANVNAYIDNLKVDSRFDGMGGSKHYYRDKKRKMPHNAVAELQDMRADTPEVEERQMLKFSADSPTVKGEDVKGFTLTFRSGYVPSFKYSADDNVYYYYFNGKQAKDGSGGKKLSFANVMVIKFDYSFADGRSNTPMIDTTGTHTVEYYIGGKHFTGTCERESIFETTKFLDDEGNEVQFLPGKTYIALPDTARKIEHTA